MKISDRITGPFLALLGAMVIVGAAQFPTIPGVKFGAGFMPTLIGIGLILLGSTIFVGGIRDNGTIKLIDISEWAISQRSKITACWCVFGLLFGGVLFEQIGFPLLGVVYMTVLMVLMGTKIKLSLLVSTLVTTALYFGFAKGLLVPLPLGLLGVILI